MAKISTDISVNRILPDDELGRYEDPAGVWEDYYIQSRFVGDPHIYMMGVTSPDGFFDGTSTPKTVSFVQLASKTLLWIVDWTASRWGDKPKIPSPVSNDPRWVFLDDMIEPANMELGPDGVTPLWRISGTYIYGNTNPKDLTVNNAYYPRPPWMDEMPWNGIDGIPTSRVVDEGTLESSLIDLPLNQVGP